MSDIIAILECHARHELDCDCAGAPLIPRLRPVKAVTVGDHVRLRYSTLNLSGRVAEISPDFVFVEIPADGGAFHRIGVDVKLANRLERA